MAAVGCHVPAQGGDLMGHAPGYDGDRAVGKARRNGLEPGGGGKPQRVLGPRIGRDVDVGCRQPQQRVADDAAGRARAKTAPLEGLEHRLRRGGGKPGGGNRPDRMSRRRACHFMRPGMTLPSLKTAGS